MTTRLLTAGLSALLALCLGCAEKRLKKPLPLARIPDLAYPVVLPPPAATGSQPVATAVNISPASAPRPAAKPPKSKPKARPRTITDKPVVSSAPSAPATPESGNSRITISAGGDNATAAIAAGLPHGDELHHRQTTTQLMQSTEENLRLLPERPTEQQQGLVAQIRNFMAQARAAQADNDLVRAHTLALKAHLLSDELVRR